MTIIQRVIFNDLRFLLGMAIVGSVAACNDSAGPRFDGINFVSGFSGSDTIHAPTPNLVVSVKDADGDPVAGALVFFQGLRDAVDGTMEVSRVGANDFLSRLPRSDTTDVDGVARIQVRYGERAGLGMVSVAVPAFGYVRAATYTVRPGNPAQILITPQDTVIAPGGSVSFVAQTLDRVGNGRIDPVTFSTSEPGVTVSSAGVATSSVVGVHWIRVTGSGITDSVSFSVAMSRPSWTLTAVRELNGVTSSGASDRCASVPCATNHPRQRVALW